MPLMENTGQRRMDVFKSTSPKAKPMEILVLKTIKAVDGFLKFPLVRWFLLVSVVALMIAAGAYKAQLSICQARLEVAHGNIATYAAYIETQNAAVLQAGRQAEEHKKTLHDAAKKSAALREEKELWRKRALGTPLTGTCDQMVDQMIQAIRH